MGLGKDQETPEVSNTKEEESSEKTKGPDQVAPDHSQLDGQTSKLTTSSGLKVHGFKNEMISLEKMLKQRQSENEFKAIGIVGVLGVGKSTLCRALLNKADIKTSFLPRIWVRMSKNKTSEAENSNEAVVKKMLKCLGVVEEIIQSISEGYKDDAVECLNALLYALHLQLSGKKYLIVLDDVWNSNEWYGDLSAAVNRSYNWKERLAYGLPKGNGGTVIVTSRNREVAEKMVGKENIHQLLPLWKQKSCWSIFKDTVERENRELNLDPRDLEQAKKDLFRKCGGLPLAAKMMGKTMAEKLLAPVSERSEIHDDGASQNGPPDHADFHPISEIHEIGAVREGPDHAGVEISETHDDGAYGNGPPDHAGVPQISETHDDEASREVPDHAGVTQISETHDEGASRNGPPNYAGVPQISETHENRASREGPDHAGVTQISETHDDGASRNGPNHAGVPQISETHDDGASRVGTPDHAGVPQISETHDDGASRNGPNHAGVPQISETHDDGASRNGTPDHAGVPQISETRDDGASQNGPDHAGIP